MNGGTKEPNAEKGQTVEAVEAIVVTKTAEATNPMMVDVTEAERTAAGVLVATAVALIGAAYAIGADGAASIKDDAAQFSIYALGAVGVFAVIASGYFGLKGIVAKKVQSGPHNPFNYQTLALTAGFLVMTISLVLVTVFSQGEKNALEEKVEKLESELKDIKEALPDVPPPKSDAAKLPDQSAPAKAEPDPLPENQSQTEPPKQ